jgi:endonuclease/exonuclease/phosphatase family metal-dependent hydrolase
VPLRVLTLNLWHDQGPWPARAARIRAWLDRLDPDVAGFQEALRGPAFDQVAALLEHRLPHRDYVEAATLRRSSGDLAFGNAIASRWPIVGRETARLPDRGDHETRAVLHCDIDAPFGPLSFTCAHLHWRLHHGAVRCRQVAAIAEQVIARRPKDGFPPVLVGDLNAEPDSDEIRFLTGLHPLDGKSVLFYDAWRFAGDGGPGITWSNRNPYARTALEPNRRIDYVLAGYPLANGLGHIERCRVVCDDAQDGVWPSDHFGVYAELRSEPLAEGARGAVF